MVCAGTIVICAVAYSLKYPILSVLPFFFFFWTLYVCAGKARTKKKIK